MLFASGFVLLKKLEELEEVDCKKYGEEEISDC